MKVVNLNSLVESLDKNSTPLNEKYSDNMPKWFKDRLLTVEHGAYLDKYHSGSYYTTSRKKNPRAGDGPTYSRKRGDYSSHPDLFSRLKNSGIDFNNVNVIEAPFPSKNSPYLDETKYIPIYLMSNGQVWAKGFNDDEDYAYENESGRHLKPFRAIPQKYIKDGCEKFAYIDLSDDNNFMGQKRVDRDTQKSELEKISSQNRSRVQGAYNRDKSGYIVNPNKYRDALIEKKGGDIIYKKLGDIYDYLEEVKMNLSEILINADPKDIKDPNSEYSQAFECYDAIYKKFKRAAEYYTEFLNNVDSAVARNENKWIRNLYRDITNKTSSLNYYVDELKSAADDLFGQVMDWD